MDKQIGLSFFVFYPSVVYGFPEKGGKEKTALFALKTELL